MTSSTSSSDETAVAPLAAEPVSTAGYGFPRAFTLAVALALPIELAAWFLPVQVAPTERRETEDFLPSYGRPGIEDTIIQAKIDYLRGDAAPVDLLVIGDSSGLMGVDARELAELTGLTTYNLCTIGWLGVEGHTESLERYISRRGTPKAVVYHFAPSSLALTESQIDGFGFLERLRTSLASSPTETLVAEPDQPLRLPSERLRPIAARWIDWEMGSSRDDSARDPWPSHRTMMNELAESDGSYREVTTTKWQEPPVVAEGVSPFQAEALRRLVRLSETEGFDLYLVANPSPEIADTPKNREAMASLKRELAEIVGDSPRVAILEPLARFWPNERCASLTHLRPEAIGENVAAIAELIESRAAAEPE